MINIILVQIFLENVNIEINIVYLLIFNIIKTVFIKKKMLIKKIILIKKITLIKKIILQFIIII